MTRITLFLFRFRTKHGVDVVRVTAYDVQEFLLSGGVVVGNSSFNQMARAVQLMIFRQFCPALTWFRHREIGVEISVGLLGFGKKVNDIICNLFQLRILMGCQ